MRVTLEEFMTTKESVDAKEVHARKPSSSAAHILQTDRKIPADEPTPQSSIGILGNRSRNTLSMRQNAVMRLQRQYGNAPTVRRIHQARSTKVQRAPRTISFTGENITSSVTTIGAGRTPTQITDGAIGDIVTVLQQFQTNYLTGIDNWQTTMQFSANQETEAHPFEAAFKWAAKKAFDEGIEALGEEIPGLSETIGILSAMKDEFDRADRAQGQVKIRDYITQLRTAFVTSINNQIPKLQQQKQPLANQYAQIAAGSPNNGSASSAGVVVGPGATFLLNLQTAVRNYQNKLRHYSPEVVRQQMSEQFATTGDTVVRGAFEYFVNGTLYLNVSVYHDGDTWQIQSVGDHWTLETNAPEPGQLADNLRISLATNNKKPYQSALNKYVKCTIENEVFGPNDYDNGGYSFTDIDLVSINNTGALLNHNDPNEFNYVWTTLNLKDRVAAVSGLTGSNG